MSGIFVKANVIKLVGDGRVAGIYFVLQNVVETIISQCTLCRCTLVLDYSIIFLFDRVLFSKNLLERYIFV